MKYLIDIGIVSEPTIDSMGRFLFRMGCAAIGASIGFYLAIRWLEVHILTFVGLQ